MQFTFDKDKVKVVKLEDIRFSQPDIKHNMSARELLITMANLETEYVCTKCFEVKYKSDEIIIVYGSEIGKRCICKIKSKRPGEIVDLPWGKKYCIVNGSSCHKMRQARELTRNDGRLKEIKKQEKFLSNIVRKQKTPNMRISDESEFSKDMRVGLFQMYFQIYGRRSDYGTFLTMINPD